MSNHLSTDPEKLSTIYDNMVAVMEGVRASTMDADDGETIAKAGHVACKTIEVDLHSRVFAQKIEKATPKQLQG